VGGWVRAHVCFTVLHNEELHALSFSPNIVTVIKSKEIIWVRHVAGNAEMRNVYRIVIWDREGRPI